MPTEGAAALLGCQVDVFVVEVFRNIAFPSRPRRLRGHHRTCLLKAKAAANPLMREHAPQRTVDDEAAFR